MKTFILLRQQSENTPFDFWAFIKVKTIEEAEKSFNQVIKNYKKKYTFGISEHEDPTGKSIIKFL